jgi:hypothetical protein
MKMTMTWTLMEGQERLICELLLLIIYLLSALIDHLNLRQDHLLKRDNLNAIPKKTIYL